VNGAGGRGRDLIGEPARGEGSPPGERRRAAGLSWSRRRIVHARCRASVRAWPGDFRHLRPVYREGVPEW